MKQKLILTKVPVIEVRSVEKTFHLPTEKASGLKQAVINRFKGIKGSTEQRILQDISFTVDRGDFFGIVGRNGCGKSTLLKIISGIYQPTAGSVSIHGSLVSFIELGVGFNGELTGRENVYMNGAMLGFSTKEIDAMYDDIVEFAELGDFMDQKLKNYSSGMQVRLAFSCAIRAKSDILVLDEVLAVGDEAFQRKCNDYFEKMKKDKDQTIVLVTHSMDNVRKYCNKAMMIESGKIVSIGDPEKVADEYSSANLPDANRDKSDDDEPQISAKILSKRVLTSADILELKIKYRAVNKRKIYPKVFIEYMGTVVMATHGKFVNNKFITSDTKEHTIVYKLPLTDFNKGECKVIVLLADAATLVNIASYGYNNEMLIKIKNHIDIGGGIFKTKAELDLIK